MSKFTHIPVLPLSGCVTLGHLRNISVPVSLLENAVKESTYFKGAVRIKSVRIGTALPKHKLSFYSSLYVLLIIDEVLPYRALTDSSVFLLPLSRSRPKDLQKTACSSCPGSQLWGLGWRLCAWSRTLIRLVVESEIRSPPEDTPMP